MVFQYVSKYLFNIDFIKKKYLFNIERERNIKKRKKKEKTKTKRLKKRDVRSQENGRVPN